MQLVRAPTKERRSWTTDSRRWAHYKPPPDDIVIGTSAKCGTTWMQNSGDVFAWAADCVGQCYELWIGHTDDPPVNSSPTVVNGKIYIGSSQHGFAGRLAVFGLR